MKKRPLTAPIGSVSGRLLYRTAEVVDAVGTACASAYKYRPNKLHKFLPWENALFTGGWIEKTIVIFGKG